MKQYKSPIEYTQDGKRYIEKMRSCSCEEKNGEHYKLTCVIQQRGVECYTYKINEEYMTRYSLSATPLYLCDEAMQAVKQAIADFEEEAERARHWKSIQATVCDCVITIYYHYVKNGDFDLYAEFGNSEITIKKPFKNSLHFLLCDYLIFINLHAEGIEGETIKKNETAIRENLIEAAINQKDELFAAVLALYYGIADDKQCARLSSLFGYRILPALPEEYNRNYIVECEGVDFELLGHSGYRVWHRPYFAMYGSTHSYYTLNPHTKQGLDAVKLADLKNGTNVLTFEEYLELFDHKSEAE